MNLSPFFCYYGGKWRAALKYPKPAFAKVIEPFAGAAGYSLRYPHLDVTLYEIDPVVFGEKKTLAEWAASRSMKYITLRDRVINKKLSMEEALTLPLVRGRRITKA